MRLNYSKIAKGHRFCGFLLIIFFSFWLKLWWITELYFVACRMYICGQAVEKKKKTASTAAATTTTSTSTTTLMTEKQQKLLMHTHKYGGKQNVCRTHSFRHWLLSRMMFSDIYSHLTTLNYNRIYNENTVKNSIHRHTHVHTRMHKQQTNTKGTHSFTWDMSANQW